MNGIVQVVADDKFDRRVVTGLTRGPDVFGRKGLVAERPQLLCDTRSSAIAFYYQEAHLPLITAINR